MASFDKEWKITWEELAPSLQTLFVTLQTEMTTLQKNYTIMVNKLEKYQQQVDANKTNIAINANEIDVLKGNLASALTDILALKELIKALNYSDPGNIQDMVDNIDQCMLDIADLKQRMAAAEVKVEDNINMIVDLRADIDLNMEEISSLKQRMTVVEDNIADLRADVDKNTEDIDELMSYVQYVVDTRADVDKNTEDIDELMSYVQYVVDTRADVDKNTEDIDSLSKRMNEFSSTVDTDFIKSIQDDTIDLRADVDVNTEDIDSIKQRLTSAASINTLQTLGNTIEDYITDLRTDVDLNTENIDSNTTRITSLENDVTDIKADVDLNTENIESNTTRITSLENDVTDIKADVDLNTENIESNRLAIVENTDSITDNRIDIDYNTEYLKTLNDDLDALPDELMAKVKAYVSSVLFMNLAPKINFLQENIVECYPYYHMNNMKKCMITSDFEGNEVIYLLANSGVALENMDMYCAYRSSDSQTFHFSNTTITPKCFLDSSGNKVSYITDILTCDNDYMIVYNTYDTGKGTSGWYLVMINNTRDNTAWTTCKDLSSVITSKTIGAKYFDDYDTLVVFNKTDYYTDLKYANIATMRIYQYSTLTLLDSKDLINPMQLLTCDTTVCSFSTTTVEGVFKDGNTGDLGFDIDTPISGDTKGFQMVCEYYPESELLVLLLKYANIVYVPLSKVSATNTSTEVLPCAIKLTWNCPVSVVNGSKGSITINDTSTNLVFNPNDKTSYFFTDNIQSENLVISYDTIKGNNYMTYHELFTYDNYFKRYQDSVQKSSTVTYYGVVEPYIPTVSINSPDASPWGKWFFKYVIAWDYIFINCASMLYGKCVIWVKGWKKDASDVTVITPKAGSYYKVDPIKVFTQDGDSSCKMSDGSPRYFHTYISGSNIIVEEYIKTETTTDFSVSTTKLYTIPINTPTWKSTMSSVIKNPMTDDTNTYIFYNAIADNFVLCITDGSHSASSYTYSDYSFLAIVNKNGNLVNTFGVSYIGSYSSNWKDICKYVQDNREINGAYAKIKTMTFLSATKACFNFFYECPLYTNKKFTNNYVNFNSAYTTMTMGNGHAYEEQQFLDQLPMGTGIIYSGNTYGLTYEGEKYDYTYQSFLTQKAMANIYGSNYTEDNFIIDGTYNRYKIQLKSSSGLILYVPALTLFLGGYCTQMDNPITVTLFPSANNYIYLERDGNTKEIKAYASTKKYIEEGTRVFSKLLIALAVTNEEDVTSITYYHINNGYNDYSYHS